MRYFIIAGERSGDLHGGNLVKALRKLDPDGVFNGFGGEYMEEAGVDLAVRYEEMAFMGLAELVTNLGRISSYIRRCKNAIRAFGPDVIVLIDYGGFNRRIARYGRREGIRVFYYIPPKVWAWYQARARDLRANVDRMFVILPFEKAFYKQFDWDVDYVGNPVLDAVKAHRSDSQFLTRESLTGDQPIIALLPGSRKQELLRIIPIMGAVARKNPSFRFVVAAIDNLDQSLYREFHGLSNVSFVFNRTYDLLQHAKAAIVTSGTATLEAALFRVPQVVVYKTSGLSYWLVRQVIRVPYISLVNLISGREVIKELIQGKANPVAISEELNLLIAGERRENVLGGYAEIVEVLDTGGSASENAATLMVKYLGEWRKA